MAGGQRLVEFFVPALEYPLRIEMSVVEIPLVVVLDFEASLRKPAVEIGNRPPQRMLCIFRGQGRRNHPEAKLVVLEACLEKRHQRVEQILLRLIEATEVCSPAHVPKNADACFP